MELYKKSDIELVETKLTKVVDDIDSLRKKLYPRETDNTDSEKKIPEKKLPDRDDVNKIVEIVLDFVKDKKRKIYGGFGLNAIIKSKNKNDAFYADDEIPDIDTYSPTPIEDLVEICDILYSRGFTDVFGTEAFHEGTYKIFTKGYNAIDLSYVPKLIYDNIPYVEIDNVRYTAPSFISIDFYRILSEPLFSSWRWEKVFKRLYLLQKYYPIKKIPNDDNMMSKVFNYKFSEENKNKITETIEEFIVNNDRIYLFGDFAYNLLVDEVDKINKANFKKVNVGIYQIVSINYKKDAVKLINRFKKKGLKITYKEHYPFWTFTGHSVEISFEGKVIVKMYNHLRRCCPVSQVDYEVNHQINNKVNNEGISKGFVQIGSFDYLLLMEMVLSFRAKVLREEEKKKYYDIMTSNIVSMREIYLNKKKVTLMDESIFQSFRMACIGATIDPVTEARKQRKEKKENNATTFNYKPVRELKTKWVFANTSGNEINNPKNLKLNKK